MTATDLRELFDYDDWATERLLAAAAALLLRWVGVAPVETDFVVFRESSRLDRRPR